MKAALFPKEEGIQAGQCVGRWTVLDSYMTTSKGERKWLCRCSCGVERYVLERALKHGESLSCGCARREHVSKSIAYDLTGKVFGNLTVLCKSDTRHKNGGIWWTCRCSCGNNCEVSATLLVTGRRSHCGCRTLRNQPIKDIVGQRFARLTALYPTENRDAKGYVMWHCRCECGNEIDVAYNRLMYTTVKSCGCRKKEHDRILNSFLSHVDGTSIDILKSKKIPQNNTTGVKGVYLIRGKYVAKIVFQKKQYFLGNYDNLEDAARARKEAETLINDTVVSYYDKWKRKAEEDPAWAQANPMRIQVEHNSGQRISVQCKPNFL